jgi:hypothetical protein
MKIILKIIISTFLVLIILKSSNAQYLENAEKPSDRFFYGGNLGLSFGTYTYIAINPVAGYRLTNRLSAGLGFNYIYMSSRQQHARYEYSLYGGSVFSSLTIIKNLNNIFPFASEYSALLLYGEYNIMNVEKYYRDMGINGKWQENPMLGFAVQTQYGRKSYLVVKVLYNFNESITSLYFNPVIKVSLHF